MITQEQLPMLAIPGMNDTHLEEIFLINRLERSAEDNESETVSRILQELIEHTGIHFSEEEKMMEESLFPAFNTHKSEHDRHLHELDSVAKYFQQHQDMNALLAYIRGNLTPWIIHHIETMDAVTATYVQQRSE